MSCLEIITTISTIVIAFYTGAQHKLIKIKRKDDIFKVRYEAYLEVIDFIHGIRSSKHIVDDLFGDDCCSDNTKICEHNYSSYYTDEKKGALIGKLSLLFKSDIVNHLTSFLELKNLQILNFTERDTKYIWYPTEEFTEPFKKYLKID